MKKPTRKDLFEFVYRADTVQKICTAERWLKDHQHLTSRETLDELITILNRTAKNLFREQLKKYEDLLSTLDFNLNVSTGEIITY